MLIVPARNGFQLGFCAEYRKVSLKQGAKGPDGVPGMHELF